MSVTVKLYQELPGAVGVMLAVVGSSGSSTTPGPDQKAESEEEGVGVISTIHAGKGLEWPRVYVTNLYEGSLPHQWSRTDREIEEERRLFYVAVTRARDVCALCIPATISYGPNTRNVSPSRFLVELRTV